MLRVLVAFCSNLMMNLFERLSTVVKVKQISFIRVHQRMINTVSTVNTPRCKNLEEFGQLDTTYRKYLIAENVPPLDGSKIRPRNVKGVHFTHVLPEHCTNPTLIASSSACTESLNLCSSEFSSQSYLSLFCGNKLIPGFDQPFCTNYGCHSYGQWFGQLGDGRAILLGEVVSGEDNKSTWDGNNYFTLALRELQLKGSGRSPYSRGFDGRAVLRSSVREFLASEAMYHLGVPTTRALTVIATGDEILRPWYGATTSHNPYAIPLEDQDNSLIRGSSAGSFAVSSLISTPSQPRKFPPDQVLREQGAIVCRVARSFLRLGHLELFAKRQEWKELLMMLDFACLREYPHLLKFSIDSKETVTEAIDALQNEQLPPSIPKGSIGRYIELFRCISQQTARLIVEWIRVGYVQGNMNSDNTLISGCTVDYGPFAFMEQYDPNYQPFTTDTRGNFAFGNQATAMATNINVLGDTVFIPLICHLCQEQSAVYVPTRTTSLHDASDTQVSKTDMQQMSEWCDTITKIAEKEYVQTFRVEYYHMICKKLGIIPPVQHDVHAEKFDLQREKDMQLWNDLLQLMFKSGCDYTIFFRELCNFQPAMSCMTIDSILSITVEKSLLSTVIFKKNDALRAEWNDWFTRYALRIQEVDIQEAMKDRVIRMKANNPKYILRNWMMAMAYERAEKKQDYALIHELMDVLSKPYDEQSSEREARWYQVTPTWARQLPGVTFMSCSS